VPLAENARIRGSSDSEADLLLIAAESDKKFDLEDAAEQLARPLAIEGYLREY